MGIPSALHQIWLQGEPPPVLRRLADRVRQLHPTFDYRLWSKNDLGQLINEAVYRELCALRRWDLACDVLRYELLAERGGVYLDLDFFLLKPLDALIASSEPVFSMEYDGLCTNAFMAIAPHHPLMWEAVRVLPMRYAAWKACGGAIIDATGPPLITELIARRGYRVNLLPEQLLLNYKGEDLTSREQLATYHYGLHLWGHQGLEAIDARVTMLDKLHALASATEAP